MQKIFAVAATAALLAGCAPVATKPITSNASLQGKRLAITSHPVPDFSAGTAGKAMFAMVGAIAMIHTGNEMVKQDQIQDPAIHIGQRLSDDLVKTQGVTVLPSNGAVASNDDAATLIKTYPGADLLLDVKTYGWSYIYYPTKWGSYRVNYDANVRLLDGKSGEVIAQQTCKIDPTDPNNPPSLDALRANQSALLKQLLGKAADVCVGEVEEHVLKMVSLN
jgi:ABC-type uncharacterized transport system auxiliary subunit